MATLFGGHVAGFLPQIWAAAERAGRLPIVFGVVLIVGGSWPWRFRLLSGIRSGSGGSPPLGSSSAWYEG